MKAAAADFSGVDLAGARARARELVPRLRERTAQAEARRVLPAETIADLHASGLLRSLQPRRWGGMELDFVAYVDLPCELARGCASTAWGLANLQIHHWMLALYDERAQEEVWGEDPDALIASGIAFPQGRGRKVEGGYVVSGRWNFSSCVNVSRWNMLAATVREGERVVDHRMCLLHQSQYEVVDDWQVLGMRGTGSMTVVANEVFVPEHRALCMYHALGGGGYPGARANPNPLYRIPLSSLGGYGIGACAIGNARAALEQSIAAVKERSTNYTGAKMRDFQTVQLRIGAAAARIDAAQRILRHDCFDGQEMANAGAAPDMEMKLRHKRNLAYAVKLATEAVDLLQEMAGANGIYAHAPMERIFRDAHALGAHISFNLDTQASSWGYVALGGTIDNPTL